MLSYEPPSALTPPLPPPTLPSLLSLSYTTAAAVLLPPCPNLSAAGSSEAMLRKSCRRWLDTQPRTAPVPVFPTKQGSAGCDPTPATAAVTRPPDRVVLVEAASAKIPPSVMQKATCFRPAILMLRPLGWPSTLATPPPKCDLDGHVDVEGSCLRPPRSLAVPPSRWRDQGCTTPTSGDISLAGCLKEKDATFSHPPIQRYCTFIVSRLCSVDLSLVGNLCYF